nr:hypothetical protein [Tanacetum cinerariifolium]
MRSLDGVEVDISNISTTYHVPTTPNTRIYKDHSLDNVIGDMQSGVQTRRMTVTTDEQGFISAIYEEKTHEDLHTWLQVKQKSDGIFINQDKYVGEILRKFKYADVKPASTPMDKEKALLNDLDGDDVDVHLYRDSPFDLLAYTNSDYARASLDRISTSRGCQFLRCRLISLQCKKQTVVATSTTEAKYVAAASCCGQTNIFRRSTTYMVEFDIGQEDDKHNMVAFLKKPQGSDDFHQIVDFLNASHIRTLDNREIKLNSTVDGQDKTITEASIRRHLKLENADGPTSPVGTQHTPTVIETSPHLQNISIAYRKTRTKTRRMGIRIPQSNIPSSVADKAITKEMHDGLGRATTTASSLEAKGSPVQARPGRLSNLPNESPLGEGNTSRSGEGSMQLLELMDICTKLSDKVTALDNELKSTKSVYNKALITLTKKVKKLEKKLKHKRRRAVVDSLEDEEASFDNEDSPKQGRMIEKINENENVNLVKSSKQGEAHETAGHRIKSDDTKVVDFSTASPDDEVTLAETLVNIKKRATIDKGEGSSKEGKSLKRPSEEELGQEQQKKQKDIFMLVEKEYPLSKGALLVMLVQKLQVDEHNEMAEELLRKIFMQAEIPRKWIRVSQIAGTKMPSEYQQDYKKTRAYAPKIYNDPNMSDKLRDIYKTLESRYIYEGRTIKPSFYNDLNDDYVAKFTAIGIYIYSDAWGLDELEKTLEKIKPYNSCLPALDDIQNLIHRRTIYEKIDKEGNTIYKLPNQIETNKLFDHLRPCELVIKENVYSTIGNRDHTQVVIAWMLYFLEIRQPFNLAYFIIRRMYFFRDRQDKVLPYGMILTRLFKNLKANMAQGSLNERYKLIPRKMSLLKAKQPKKPLPKRTRNVGKSKRNQLTTSSLNESPPSGNEYLHNTKLSPRSYHRALKDDPNMSKEQRETKRMFKNLGQALHNFAKMLKKGCR